MKRLLILAVAALTASGCAAIHDLRTDDKPYERPFYAKYLNTGSTLDAHINRTLIALRENPNAPDLHNTLGALLVDKGFPKDAEREFERAVNADRNYYQAWYNLGLVRAASGDELGARRAFSRTIDIRPGHSQALFQLGLVEEKRHHTDRAIDLYAKAFKINPSLMRVDVNPRILDSKLTHVALLKLYPSEHARRSMTFLGSVPAAATPAPAPPPSTMPAPSPQPAPQNIVTPAPPATQVGAEQTPVSAPSSPFPPGRRSNRGRQPRPRPEQTPAPEVVPQPAPASEVAPDLPPQVPPPPPPSH